MAVYDEEKQVDAAGSDEKLDAAEKQAFDDIAQADTDKDFDDIIRNNFDPEEVAAMEKRGSSDGDESDAEKGESKSIAANTDFFKEDGGDKRQKTQGFFSRNRGRATIGIGLAVLIGGGGFGLFAILAGPLQFVQIAKMLQGFHFSNQEDASDNRMMKIARYIKYNGDQNTRLGVLGNRFANSIETRLNRAGIQSSYGLASYGDGYIIDPLNAPGESEFSKLKDLDLDGQKQFLGEKFNISPESISLSAEGKLFVSSEGLGYFESKKLIRTALQEAGYSKIGSAIRSRIMGKRAGLDWHPIKKLDKKVLQELDARLKKWRENREERVRNGAEDNPKVTAGEDVDTDGDGTADSSSADIEAAADTANNPTAADPDLPPKTGVPEPEIENIKGKLGKAGAVSAVVGLVCLAKGIADNIDSIKQANVVMPLMRLGGEGLAIGNQIITGQNLDSEQLGFFSKQLFDRNEIGKAGASWRSAQSIQAELGEDLTGPDIGPEASIANDRNAISQILNNIPGVGTACDVVNSVIGQIVMTAIDFAGGPFSALAGTVFGATLGPKIIDGFARWLAGKPINLNVAGANYGNYINYGARLAANDSIIASGGVKLTSSEVAELRQDRIKTEQEDYQQKNIFAKLFDPYDVRSPLGNFMSEQAPDPAQNIARVAVAVPRTVANMFKIPSFITGKAHAAANLNYDYGFPEYGYSVSDLNSPYAENPLDNAEKVNAIINGDGGSDYAERAAKCFGIKFVQVSGVLAVRSTGNVPAYYDMPDECTDRSEQWTRIRFFIFDSQMMEGYACYENDTTSCDEFGFSGSSSSNSGAATQGIEGLSCEGYLKLTSQPATIVNGLPTNTTLINYSDAVKSACETTKTNCQMGVAGTIKALCEAYKFHDSWYGSTALPDKAQQFYGFTAATNGLHNPVGWLDRNEPGLNPYNLLECSALTSVAVYRAFGYSGSIGCSGNWGQRSHSDLFREVSSSEVQPGDFLTTTFSCNIGGSGGHVAIAASTVSAGGKVVIYEQSAHGTTAHFREVDYSYFAGNHSRWIGPGI